MNTQASLKIGQISYVPFDNYPNDFTFIVNKEEYHTNKLIADLLSKTISKNHLTDPTIDQYEIYTEYPGDFQQILDLIKVDTLEIKSSEIPFFTEIIKTLDIDVNIKGLKSNQLTIDNVMELIHAHEKFENFYSDFLREEIEFISKNFHKLKETQENSLLSLSTITIQSILSNENLCLKSEDQLLDFVNKLYVTDRTLSHFYEFVKFSNVSRDMIDEFATVFNVDDITGGTWDCILTNLCLGKKYSKRKNESNYVTQGNNNFDINKNHHKRYINNISLTSSTDNFTGVVFDGIFNHLRQINKINSFVKVSFSSDGCGFDVKKLIMNDNSDFSFSTRDIANSWICFKFIKCQVSVTHYTIRTDKWINSGGNHPRSWVIEGFNGIQWEVIDERVNNGSLNGAGIVCTFEIQRKTNRAYNSIRMKLTDTNWNNKNYLMLNAIELYGNILR